MMGCRSSSDLFRLRLRICREATSGAQWCAGATVCFFCPLLMTVPAVPSSGHTRRLRCGRFTRGMIRKSSAFLWQRKTSGEASGGVPRSGEPRGVSPRVKCQGRRNPGAYAPRLTRFAWASCHGFDNSDDQSAAVNTRWASVSITATHASDATDPTRRARHSDPTSRKVNGCGATAASLRSAGRSPRASRTRRSTRA